MNIRNRKPRQNENRAVVLPRYVEFVNVVRCNSRAAKSAAPALGSHLISFLLHINYILVDCDSKLRRQLRDRTVLRRGLILISEDRHEDQPNKRATCLV